MGCLSLFMNIMMAFNIDNEINQVAEIFGDVTFVRSLCSLRFPRMCMNQSYVLNIIQMTMKYPEIEPYLKNLFTKFPVDELLKSDDFVVFLMCKIEEVSLNAFEIILNCGINVNYTDDIGNSVLHNLLAYTDCDSHTNNILNLFIKHNFNLNIINNDGYTILDQITYSANLRKHTKRYIITLLDNGAKTNKPNKKNDVWDFIESYLCSNIKPAIKNENNI